MDERRVEPPGPANGDVECPPRMAASGRDGADGASGTPDYERIGSRWKWLMDIIFGGILVFGFQRFGHDFDTFSAQSSESEVVASLAAAGALGFFIYDVTVYQIFSERFPYGPGARSGLRFVLDVLMALILALLLFPALGGQPWRFTGRILVTVSIWHLCALVWHVLADPKVDPGEAAKRSWPHVACIASYWAIVAVLAGATRAVDGGPGGVRAAVDSRPCLAALSIALIGAAVFRTHHVVRGRSSSARGKTLVRVEAHEGSATARVDASAPASSGSTPTSGPGGPGTCGLP